MKLLAPALGVLGLLAAGAAAEPVKVGTTRLIGYVGVPVGLAHGYFQAAGLEIEQV